MQSKAIRHERKNSQGEVWEVWWECNSCEGSVDPHDIYCKHCGRKLAVG